VILRAGVEEEASMSRSESAFALGAAPRKKRAYRVKLRPVAQGPEDSPAKAQPTDLTVPEPTGSDIWTRTAVLVPSDGDEAVDELRYFENVALPLDEPGADGVPELVELALYQVCKGLKAWRWSQPRALLGTAQCRVWDLAADSRAGEAQVLEIMAPEGHPAALVHAKAYVPESAAGRLPAMKGAAAPSQDKGKAKG